MNELACRVEMHNPQQGHAALTGQGWPWAKSMLMAGHRLVVEFRPLDDEKTERQRRYYHGVVLTEIAQQAVVNGQRFPMHVWKEYYRDKFLGHKVKSFVNPVTGRKVRRRVRVSTEDLGVKAYSELIEKVTADAATEHGVEFSVKRWEDYQE